MTEQAAANLTNSTLCHGVRMINSACGSFKKRNRNSLMEWEELYPEFYEKDNNSKLKAVCCNKAADLYPFDRPDLFNEEDSLLARDNKKDVMI